MANKTISFLKNSNRDFHNVLDSLNPRLEGFTSVLVTVALTRAQSGQTIILGDADGLSSDTIISLPTAENGLSFRFTYVGGAADAHDFQLNTTSDTNCFIGGIVQQDVDNGGDDTAIYHPNNSSNSRINFLTPDSGTWAECFCDGTNWFVNACLISATDTGITFADQ